jgi:hypothetical protein
MTQLAVMTTRTEPSKLRIVFRGAVLQIDHHDPVGVERLVAVVVEALKTQASGQSLKVIAVDDQHIEAIWTTAHGVHPIGLTNDEPYVVGRYVELSRNAITSGLISAIWIRALRKW